MKLSNFRIQEDGSSKTILMDNRLQIAETKVSFPLKPIPQTNNIALLSGVHLQQLITIKAKVTRTGATKTVTTSNGVKRKADCYLIDSSGTIKLPLWKDFINHVQEGKTYTLWERHLSCLQCCKKIADGSFSAKILKCRHCGITQEKDKCLENCYAQAKVSQDDNQFVITFFHEKIKNIFDLLHLPHSLNEEQVTEALLDSPILIKSNI